MKNSEQRHYFVSRQHSVEDYFEFTSSFENESFVFKSCNDVFSKNELDYGSLVLVKSILKHISIFSGKIMDMCCGYGTIAILLSRFINAEFYLSDINSTAVELAKENVKQNTKILPSRVLVSDMFDSIEESFNHVVSNPPIKAGKENLNKFVSGAYSHIISKGTLTLVIKKNLGMESLKKYITEIFGNCEIWQRDKGYYILHAVKN